MSMDTHMRSNNYDDIEEKKFWLVICERQKKIRRIDGARRQDVR